MHDGSRLGCALGFVSMLLGTLPGVATDSGASLPQPPGMSRVLAGAAPDGFGGGPLAPPTDAMSEARRDAIKAAIRESVERLRGEARLSDPEGRTPGVLFGWPVRLAPGLDDPGHHGIAGFVDENPAYPNLVLDFACGTRTYDTGNGYNHQGTDIFTWPWSWLKMDKNHVQVVAAAPGQIVYRSDGHSDRSCSPNGNDWNAIYVRHTDGSIAWYGHMKKNSLTAKSVGESVFEGEFLGVVGSSGNSTGPHLHFEVYDTDDELIDPWQGSCNSLNPDSWWQQQRPYYDSALNRLTTGDAPPTFPSCSTQENPRSKVTFSTGPQVVFSAYYRDQLATQATIYTVYRPDGSIYAQWSHNNSGPDYPATYWYWTYDIPSNEAQGTWRFTADYLAETHERRFTIGSPAACGRVPQYPVHGTPLAVVRSGSQIRLTWGASCNSSDTSYVVYEGALGSFASHVPVLCSTGTQREATFTPGSGGRYYLVGPRNASREGSLGRASAGTERPEGTTTCLPRLALACP